MCMFSEAGKTQEKQFSPSGPSVRETAGQEREMRRNTGESIPNAFFRCLR